MLHETLQKIETRLKGTASLPVENRQELLTLVSTLKAEVAELAKTHQEQAQSIAGFTQITTHEATRAGRDPALLKHSLNGLSASVSGFEQSHPRLVEIVNRISTMLSNCGI
jgi:hypothetical protein